MVTAFKVTFSDALLLLPFAASKSSQAQQLSTSLSPAIECSMVVVPSSLLCPGERSGRPHVADALTTPVCMTSTYFFRNTAHLIDFVVSGHSLWLMQHMAQWAQTKARKQHLGPLQRCLQWRKTGPVGPAS